MTEPPLLADLPAPRAMLVTAPASPEWVVTVTQVLRSTASAMALPVSPECPFTLAPLAELGVPATPATVASALPLAPELACTVACRPAPAKAKLLPVSPVLASDNPLVALHTEHDAAACPESPLLTTEFAPSTPIAIPAESPVDPLIAMAVGLAT